MKTSERVSVCSALLTMLLVWGEPSATGDPQADSAVNSTATNEPASPSSESAPAWAVPGLAKAQDAANRIQLNAALSHSTYSQSNPASLLLKVDLVPVEATATNRAPRNIALVIDRSASMADEQKFPFVMEAARAVIDN